MYTIRQDWTRRVATPRWTSCTHAMAMIHRVSTIQRQATQRGNVFVALQLAPTETHPRLEWGRTTRQYASRPRGAVRLSPRKESLSSRHGARYERGPAKQPSQVCFSGASRILGLGKRSASHVRPTERSLRAIAITYWFTVSMNVASPLCARPAASDATIVTGVVPPSDEAGVTVTVYRLEVESSATVTVAILGFTTSALSA